VDRDKIRQGGWAEPRVRVPLSLAKESGPLPLSTVATTSQVLPWPRFPRAPRPLPLLLCVTCYALVLPSLLPQLCPLQQVALIDPQTGHTPASGLAHLSPVPSELSLCGALLGTEICSLHCGPSTARHGTRHREGDSDMPAVLHVWEGHLLTKGLWKVKDVRPRNSAAVQPAPALQNSLCYSVSPASARMHTFDHL
jgi:hypothetical protein